MIASSRLWLLGVTFICLVFAGCASNKLPLSKEDFGAAMEQSGLKVDALLEKGNQEEAIAILGDLAKTNPARKEPWVRMAKAYFDAGNYGQAIVSADEALHRDAADRTAKSILAVSGLRVATRSLAELRNDVELRGSARSDAVGLAKMLRETLGEDVLVPPPEVEVKKRRDDSARIRAAQRAKQREVTAPVSGAHQGGGSSASGGSDPFSVLK